VRAIGLVVEEQITSMYQRVVTFGGAHDLDVLEQQGDHDRRTSPWLTIRGGDPARFPATGWVFALLHKSRMIERTAPSSAQRESCGRQSTHRNGTSLLYSSAIQLTANI